MTISEMMKNVNANICEMITLLTAGEIVKYMTKKEETDALVKEYNDALQEEQYKKFSSLHDFFLKPYILKLSYQIIQKHDKLSNADSYEKKLLYKSDIGNMVDYFKFSGKKIEKLSIVNDSFAWALDSKTATESDDKTVVLMTVSGLRKAFDSWKKKNKLEEEKDIALNQNVAIQLYSFFHETSKTVNHLRNDPAKEKTQEKFFKTLTIALAQRAQGKNLSFDKEKIDNPIAIQTIAK